MTPAHRRPRPPELATTLPWEPDILLSTQWAARMGTIGAAVDAPVRQLYLALVLQALADLEKARDRHQKAQVLARTALDWVLADTPGWPFAFPACCALFGIDVTAARAVLVARYEALCHGTATPASAAGTALLVLRATGWHWDRVAAALGVSTQTISQWFTGTTAPRDAALLARLEALADAAAPEARARC